MSNNHTTPPFTPSDKPSTRAYLSDVKKFKEITDDDLRRCYALYNVSKDVRDLYPVINANLKFVLTIAKEYIGCGLEFGDLVGEGNDGLIKAATDFDCSRGRKFTTYAVFKIRYAIRNALTYKSHTVRPSEGVLDLLYKIKEFISDYILRYGQEPYPSEIADKLGVTEEKIADILAHSTTCASLDTAFVSDSENFTLMDVIPDKNADMADKGVIDLELKEGVGNAIASLNEREAFVIRHYYGIGCEQMDNAEMAAYLRVTQSRIRQIRKEAAKKLRGIPRICQLYSSLAV